MDLAAKTFKDLAKFEGMDSWPLGSRDGFIYFVSDREGKGLTNVWRIHETGGVDADDRRRIGAVLDRVAEEILQQALELLGVAANDR